MTHCSTSGPTPWPVWRRTSASPLPTRSPSGSNQATSARVVAGWPGAVTGDLTISNKAFTGGAANGPVTHVCLWSAITGGTFYGSVALTGDTTFNSAGEYTITSLTVNGSST